MSLAGALICQASVAILRKRLVQSWPRRVKTLTSASFKWTCLSQTPRLGV